MIVHPFRRVRPVVGVVVLCTSVQSSVPSSSSSSVRPSSVRRPSEVLQKKATSTQQHLVNWWYKGLATAAEKNKSPTCRYCNLA